jgi:hypothetical protein
VALRGDARRMGGLLVVISIEEETRIGTTLVVVGPR